MRNRPSCWCSWERRTFKFHPVTVSFYSANLKKRRHGTEYFQCTGAVIFSHFQTTSGIILKDDDVLLLDGFFCQVRHSSARLTFPAFCKADGLEINLRKDE